jgi:hypothetical protein
LRQVAADPKHLGAQLGVVAVLHTWGQTLQHHPHVHCVVSGGGLAVDAAGHVQEPARWVACRPGFFVPVKVLGAVYRGKFLAALRAAFVAGRLQLHGRLATLAAPAASAAWLQPLYAKPWVVYSKPPFAGSTEVVLKYLARYTHRIALSNRRLVDLSADGQVTFTYKDYAHGGKPRTMTLAAAEFLRRYLQHVLPKGFVKVRHYGLLANGQRERQLAVCRRRLLVLGVVLLAAATVTPAVRRCPECGVGGLHCVEELPGAARRPRGRRVVSVFDTSGQPEQQRSSCGGVALAACVVRGVRAGSSWGRAAVALARVPGGVCGGGWAVISLPLARRGPCRRDGETLESTGEQGSGGIESP